MNICIQANLHNYGIYINSHVLYTEERVCRFSVFLILSALTMRSTSYMRNVVVPVLTSDWFFIANSNTLQIACRVQKCFGM
jgi:hypothetical protein